MDYEYIKQNASDLGKCGEHLHWYYLHETLYIGGEGEMTEFPWHKLYAGQIKYVYVGNGCVNVKRGAFHDCPCLKTVDIPESVKIIDAFAFRRCKNLQTVT